MKHQTRIHILTFICSIALLATAFVLPAKAADASSAAGVVSTASSNLNVRASASTTAAILTRLPKGSYVTLLSKSGSFWRVEYADGAYGYVHADYITQTASTPVNVSISSGYLNVRSGVGTSYSAVAKLYKGDTVLRLSESGGWSRILYAGTRVGYVSSAYITSVSSSSAVVWPVPASRRINQYFKAGTHLGLDIGASTPKVEGDAVLAAMPGKVLFAGYLGGYGHVIYINSYHNGQYIQTRYAHLQSASEVTSGQTVAAGQRIAPMGNSGTSSGAHLHFEVRIRSSAADCFANADSTPVDPLPYLS
ncbi:MAG: peptidoglycan DD-metalloendopeptidase family protein [Oscillospiraceae bacterium]|jgi:murein DD-endopeptidase MepM/ murein hydrolase activator NlpD|nr:peptidoglycan DD-metalloendopeptidase family protein [Oscillospiraceae bacterium]